MNEKLQVVFIKYWGHLKSHELRNFENKIRAPNKTDQEAFFAFFNVKNKFRIVWKEFDSTRFSYLCLLNFSSNSLGVGTVISFDSVRPPCEIVSLKQQLIRNLIHVDRSTTFDLGIDRIFSHLKYKYYYLSWRRTWRNT